jgi:hypothetical protein
MAGYNHSAGMSNNAVEAYDAGLRPASRTLSGVSATLIARFCEAAEWHHSSGWYNTVDFYDCHQAAVTFGKAEPCDDPDCDCAPNASAIAALAESKTKRAEPATLLTNQTVEWIDWSGTRNHPKATERKESGCTVAVKGKTATITLPNGTTFTKRLTTNGFAFRNDAAPTTQTK